MAKVVELIYAESQEGLGKENDPVRRTAGLYTKSGELVAFDDPCDKSENFFNPNIINN